MRTKSASRQSLALSLSLLQGLADPAFGVSSRGPEMGWHHFFAASSGVVQIPVLTTLGITLDSPEKMASFAALMESVRLSPEALVPEMPTAAQADVIREALTRHAQGMADVKTAPEPIAAYVQLVQKVWDDKPEIAAIFLSGLPGESANPAPALSPPTPKRPQEITANAVPAPTSIAPTAPVPFWTRTINGISEAIHWRLISGEYKPERIDGGIRLEFSDPIGVVRTVVDTANHARKLIRAYETAGSKDVFGVGAFTPDARYVRFDRNKPISFGLEMEMTIARNPNVVNDYRLTSYSAERWRAMNRYERIDAVQNALDDPSLYGKTFMLRLPEAPAQLPERLIREQENRFELNGVTFQSMSECKRYAYFLRDRYGDGYFQGHVAWKNHLRVGGIAGFSIFGGDAAQLRTLERGHERSLKNPRFIPGSNLTHFHLRALIDEEHKGKLLDAEKRARDGEYPVKNKLLVYAPVFRGNYLYGRDILGVEFRESSTNLEELLQKMDDFSSHLVHSGDFMAFKPFEKIKLISRDLVRERLEEFGFSTTEAISWALALAPGNFIGFLMPLRDWKNHPVIAGLDGVTRLAARQRIDDATHKYISSATDHIREIRSTGQDISALPFALRRAAALWAHEANLSQYFDDFRAKAFGGAHSPSGTPLVRLVDVESHDIFAELPWLARRKTFVGRADQREYASYEAKIPIDPNSAAYQRFLDSTVEAIFSKDHFRIRVGRRLYDLNGPQEVYMDHFDISKIHSDRVGFVFHVDPRRIRQVQAKVEDIFKNSRDFNVPGFDAFSHELEIIKQPDGTLQYESASTIKPNDLPLTAKLVQTGRTLELETPSGFRYPVTERDGKLYTQGLSCSSSTTYILEKFFGIEIDFGLSPIARLLHNAFLAGNPRGQAPDAIIHYGSAPR